MANLLFDATSLIQLKIVETGDDRTIYTPYLGEPIYEVDTGRMYIGDGVTAGGNLLNLDTDENVHVLASESGSGPQHTIDSTSVGSVLRVFESGDARFEKLNFDDLVDDGSHSLQTAHYSLYTHSIPHVTGTDLGDGKYSVWYTSYNSIANDGGKNALYATRTGGVYALAFGRLGYADLTGTPTVIGTHAITSSYHTASANQAFYSNSSGVVSQAAIGVSGTVFKSNGVGSAPTFTKLGYADITGYFTGVSGSTHYTMRYNGGGQGWLATGALTVDDTGVSNTLLTMGLSTKDNTLVTLYAIEKHQMWFKVLDTGAPTNGCNGLIKLQTASSNTNENNMFAFYCDNSNGVNKIGFFTYANTRGGTPYPDVTIDEKGRLILGQNSNSYTSLTADISGILNVPTVSATVTSGTVQRGLTVINLNDLDFYTSRTEANITSNTSSVVAYLKTADITVTAAAITTSAKIPTAAYAYFGDITTQGAAYGIRLGNITAETGNAIGLYVKSTTSAEGYAFGIAIDNATATAEGLASACLKVGSGLIPDDFESYSICVLSGSGDFYSAEDLSIGSTDSASFDLESTVINMNKGYIRKRFMVVTLEDQAGPGFGYELYPAASNITSITINEFDKDYLRANSDGVDPNGSVVLTIDSGVTFEGMFDYIKNIDTIIIECAAVETDLYPHIKAIPPGYPHQKITVILTGDNDTSVFRLKAPDHTDYDEAYNILSQIKDEVDPNENWRPVYLYAPLELVFAPYYTTGTETNSEEGRWLLVNNFN